MFRLSGKSRFVLVLAVILASGGCAVDSSTRAGSEPNQAEFPIQAIRVAGNDPLEESIQGTRFMLIGVLVNLEQRRDNGNPNGRKLFDREITRLPVRALNRGKALNDLLVLGRGSGFTTMDRQQARQWNRARLAVNRYLDSGNVYFGFAGGAILCLHVDGGLFC